MRDELPGKTSSCPRPSGTCGVANPCLPEGNCRAACHTAENRAFSTTHTNGLSWLWQEKLGCGNQHSILYFVVIWITPLLGFRGYSWCISKLLPVMLWDCEILGTGHRPHVCKCSGPLNHLPSLRMLSIQAEFDTVFPGPGHKHYCSS